MYTRRATLTAAVAATAGLAGCQGVGIEVPGVGGGDELAQGDLRREVLDRYDAAIEARNEGISTRDRAIGLFNDEQYQTAVDEFETARTRFRSAATDLEAAVEAAAELDSPADSEGGSGSNASNDGGSTPGPAAICERTLAEVQTQIEATDAGQAAAVAAAEGADGTTINDHVTEYQSLVEEASATPVTEPDRLSTILGF